MTNQLDKLYIKQYYNNNCSINDTNIPFKYLPHNYNKNNYTIFEKIYNIYDYYENDFYVESSYNTCYLCKKNINVLIDKNNIKVIFKILNSLKLNENLIEKIKKNIELKIKNKNNVFIFQSKINFTSFVHYHYHLCESCYKSSLYYWKFNNNNYYPINFYDGYRFIHENDKFVPEVKDNKSIKYIEKLNIPNVYYCKYQKAVKKNINNL